MGQWHAEVLSQIDDFSRQSVLPVVCSVGENVSSTLEALSNYPSWYSQRQIHVLGRNVVSTLGEVVYLGAARFEGRGRRGFSEWGAAEYCACCKLHSYCCSATS